MIRKMLLVLLRILILLAVLAALVVGGALLVKHKQEALAKAPTLGLRPTPVRVAEAHRGDLVERLDYIAVAEPIREANISARLTATVEKVLFLEGEQVKEGDVLIELDSREVRNNIASMQAQVEQAEADLASNEATVAALGKSVEFWDTEVKRSRALLEKKIVSAADYDATADKANDARGKLDAAKKKSLAIERQIESLKQKKAELETTLSYCTIRSPYTGGVRYRYVDPGDMALPGKTLLVVADRTVRKLSFDVPQQDLPRVRVGVEVTFTVQGSLRRARVSHMLPSLNVARMARAEVYVEGDAREGLICGAYVPLSVILGRKAGVTLMPASCVIESPDGKPYVFVAADGALASRPVQVLGSSGDEVAVAGVEPGMQVVVSTFLGWAVLSSGQKVEVMKWTSPASP